MLLETILSLKNRTFRMKQKNMWDSGKRTYRVFNSMTYQQPYIHILAKKFIKYSSGIVGSYGWVLWLCYIILRGKII